eukprot:TRINITY_DN4160_c0_g1_i5.p1 TRINITY_DN4160_c0_g1~~TRINITY_DN4160_c0_g1_i5.p1  ORF type:complete len:578 (-),score=96.18 TRINITY_DN4160_c0_g1_i5:3-1700(-)
MPNPNGMTHASSMASNSGSKPVTKASSMASASPMPDSWTEVENMLDPLMPRDPFRARIAMVLKSNTAEAIVAVIILASMCLLIFETDYTADGGEPPRWALACNTALLVIYVLELIVKLWVYRLLFFLDKGNLIDVLVVGVDLSLLITDATTDWSTSSSFRIVRTFRLVRMVRSFRILRQFDELNLLIESFEAAMKSISWGMLIIFVMTTSFSVLAVEMIHPINYEIWKDDDSCMRCRNAFSSVWNSNLTIFQTVIAGDSWGTLALPIIDREPWAALFFLIVLVTISMTMLNLVLAIIVEAAQEAKLADMHQKSVMQEQEMMKAKEQLLSICKTIDSDESGYLTISEFLNGFDNNGELADLLKCMDISKDDLTCVFNVLDTDGSGDINCYEFVDQLHRLKSQQSQQILFTVTEIKKMLVMNNIAHAHEKDNTQELKLDQTSQGVSNATTHPEVNGQGLETKVEELLQQLRQDKADMLMELSKEMTRSMKNLQESLMPTLSAQMQMVSTLHAERPLQQQLQHGQPRDLGDSKFCWGLSQGSSNPMVHSGQVSGLPPYRVQAPAAQGT